MVEKRFPASGAALELISWYCAALLVSFILMALFSGDGDRTVREGGHSTSMAVSRPRACDEIYVIEEGDTFHTISEKCGDPYILERNPHIHDPDDVFPGVVIRLSPFTHR